MLYFSCCDTAWRSPKLKGPSSSNPNPEQKQYALLQLQVSFIQLETLVCPEKTTDSTTVSIFCASVVGRPERGHQSRRYLCLTSNRGPQAALK